MKRTSEQVDSAHAFHAGSGPHDGPRCDCHHDGVRWVKMCAAAAAAYQQHRAALQGQRNAPAV